MKLAQSSWCKNVKNVEILEQLFGFLCRNQLCKNVATHFFQIKDDTRILLLNLGKKTKEIN